MEGLWKLVFTLKLPMFNGYALISDPDTDDYTFAFRSTGDLLKIGIVSFVRMWHGTILRHAFM